MVAQNDLFYGAVLLLSIGFGKVTRNRTLCIEHQPWVRKTLSTAAGVLIGVVVCGARILQPIFLVTMQVVLLKVLPTAHLHWVSFLCGFTHLTLYRLLDPHSDPADYIQMFVTLKMVGLALEVKEARLRGQSASLIDQLVQNARTVDVFHYTFTHAGFLTGPYFKFRTFQDMYLNPWSLHADCEGLVGQRIYHAAIYLILYLGVNWTFPTDYMKEEAFFTETSLLYRIFYLLIALFTFILRISGGIFLAECSCIMAGLGAYPSASKPTPGKGPTEHSEMDRSQWLSSPGNTNHIVVDFHTIQSMDMFTILKVTTIREFTRVWNMTIQHWMAVNVYKQLQQSSFLPKPLKAAIVFLLSALWHSIHPCYFFSMCCIPLFVMVENLYKQVSNSILARWSSRPTQGNKIRQPGMQVDVLVFASNTLAWFFRWQWSAYLMVPYIVQNVNTGIRIWASVYYFGHLSGAVFYGALRHTLKKFLN